MLNIFIYDLKYLFNVIQYIKYNSIKQGKYIGG
jgi:hypothetical protein